jgi:hypothetical protein
MDGKRRWIVIAMVVPIAVAWRIVSPPPGSLTTAPPMNAPSASEDSYLGVAGCAAMACHGGTRPEERHEYTTWIQRDRHSQAFLILYDDRSQRIASQLGIDKPERDARCLACHSTAPEAPHGPKFSVEDGVSCEACHGAASRWLVPHTQPDWKHKSAQEKTDSFGLVNTKDLTQRAVACVRCHVGEPGRDVGHDLIAAGHPALRFELDAYTANLPPHWREDFSANGTLGAQAWAVGQAVMLRQSLELLAARAKGTAWPELAEFECTACHHDLRANSWRRDADPGERRPGSPMWRNSHAILAGRAVLSQGAQAAGGDELQELQRAMANVAAPATSVAAAADRAALAAARLIDQVARLTWDRARLVRLLRELAAEPNEEGLDYTSAANTTMALGAVSEAIARATSGTDAAARPRIADVRAILDRLYDDVKDPSAYSAPAFSTDLKALRSVLQ